MLKNDFFGFPKIKWLHLTGEVVKSVRFSCRIFSRFNIPKIIKIGQFLTELFKNKKVDVFWGHRIYALLDDNLISRYSFIPAHDRPTKYP